MATSQSAKMTILGKRGHSIFLCVTAEDAKGRRGREGGGKRAGDGLTPAPRTQIPISSRTKEPVRLRNKYDVPNGDSPMSVGFASRASAFIPLISTSSHLSGSHGTPTSLSQLHQGCFSGERLWRMGGQGRQEKKQEVTRAVGRGGAAGVKSDTREGGEGKSRGQGSGPVGRCAERTSGRGLLWSGSSRIPREDAHPFVSEKEPAGTRAPAGSE